MNPLLHAALDLAKRGFRVFPLLPRSKRPAIEDNLRLATTDELQIRRWWKQWPWANIGVAVDGAVLDVDPRNGGDKTAREWFAEHGEPNTLTVETWSGGRHYYFSTPIRSSNKVAPGIDVKGGGTGYVVGPGSVIENKTYRIIRNAPIAEAPEWLIEKAKREPEKRPVLVDGAILEGERNNALFRLAATMRAAGADEDSILAALSTLNETRCDPPLPDEEVRRIAKSAARYPREPLASEEFEVVEGATPPPAGESGNPRLDALRGVNERYALVHYGTDVVVLDKDRNDFVKVGAFQLKLRNQFIPNPTNANGKPQNLATAWLEWEGRQLYDSAQFLPGVKDEDLPPGVYNLWRGWPVEPNPEGSCDLFLSHLREVVCNENEAHFEWLMNWFAHTFQFPMEKPHTTVALRGNQGVGKTIVGQVIGKLLGPYRVSSDKVEQIIGRFNSYLERCLLIQAEEAFWGGDKKSAGRLKGLVTSSETLIERKGMDAIMRPNYARLLITSNEDRIWPTTVDDRRLMPFEVSSKRKGDIAYFKAMLEELENGGYGRLMHELLTWPVNKDWVMEAPATEALYVQADESMTHEEWWLRTLLDDGQLPIKERLADGSIIISSDTLYRMYERTAPRGHHCKNEKAFGWFVKKYLLVEQAGRAREGGKIVRLYKIPSLRTCREEFLTRGRGVRPFDNMDDEWVSTDEFDLL